MPAATHPRTSVRRLLLAVPVAALAALLTLLLLADRSEPLPPQPDPVTSPTPVETPLTMPLTGVPTTRIPDRPALLVKVSNSPEARPQTGLECADVVFEELTEGGITRFVAVFHSRLPEVVGPVRSARPVDAALASGFGRPGLAFSGARAEVVDLLDAAPLITIREGDPGFFRDGGVHASHPFAPHDLFLRPDEALDVLRERGARPLGDIDWVFADDVPFRSLGVGSLLTIEMSASYHTTWRYDAGAGLYRRQQNGVDSAVTGPDPIGAANVIVLATRHYIGTSGYPETDVVGEGDALVLRDGQRYGARWSKPDATSPLRILTSESDAFPLRPGSTWIHLPDRLPVDPPDHPGSRELP